MIKPSKIQEWIEEIEQRPMAAPFIVRSLSARLIELDKLNEELRVENLKLQSDKKVQEYERRIAELEYQIKLLKRQVTEGVTLGPTEQPSLLIYDSHGRILATDFEPSRLVSGHIFGGIAGFTAQHPEDIHLLTANTSDELLFLFDSGRVQTQRSGELRHLLPDQLDWQAAVQIDMRSGERLVSIVPITKIPLMDGCLQFSRKGYARFISQEYLQTFLSEKNIGRGIRTNADMVFTLVPCKQDDVYVLVTRQGYISARETRRLSITLEEIQKFDLQDYLIGAFTIRPEQQLIITDQAGGIYIQKNPWEDPASATGSKRRLLLTGMKSGGVEVIGAGAAVPGSWHFRLTSTGQILIGKVADTTLPPKTQPLTATNSQQTILAFTIWQPAEAVKSK